MPGLRRYLDLQCLLDRYRQSSSAAEWKDIFCGAYPLCSRDDSHQERGEFSVQGRLFNLRTLDSLIPFLGKCIVGSVRYHNETSCIPDMSPCIAASANMCVYKICA